MAAREAVYGAPEPPGGLFAIGVLHPPPDFEPELYAEIAAILIDGAPVAIAEVYRALVARGAMAFDADCVHFREHPTIKAIAGACQYLHFSGRLAAIEGAPGGGDGG